MFDLIPLIEVIKVIYTKVFKKESIPRCSTNSKAFFETIEKEYPAWVVYEDNAACLHFAKRLKLSLHTQTYWTTIPSDQKQSVFLRNWYSSSVICWSTCRSIYQSAFSRSLKVQESSLWDVECTETWSVLSILYLI